MGREGSLEACVDAGTMTVCSIRGLKVVKHAQALVSSYCAVENLQC